MSNDSYDFYGQRYAADYARMAAERERIAAHVEDINAFPLWRRVLHRLLGCRDCKRHKDIA